MGSRTDEAERRVAEQRAVIEQRLESLSRRTREDAEEVRDRARGRLSDASERIPGRDPLLDMFQDHPFSSLAGAFGAGVALGVASDSLPSMRDGAEEPDARDRRSGSRQEGALERLMTPLVASMAAPVQEELRNWVRDALNGVSSGRRGGSADGRDRSDGHPMGREAAEVDRPPATDDERSERASAPVTGGPPQ